MTSFQKTQAQVRSTWPASTKGLRNYALREGTPHRKITDILR